MNYSIEPKKQNKLGWVYTIVSGAVAVGMFLATVIWKDTIKLRPIVQSVAVCLFVYMLYCLTWQLKSRLRYEVSPSGIADQFGTEKFDLVIYRVYGDKLETLCRIGVGEIKSVERIIRDTGILEPPVKSKKSIPETRTKEEDIKKIREARSELKKYRYCPDMLPSNLLVINTDEVTLTLSYDRTLYDILKNGAGIEK